MRWMDIQVKSFGIRIGVRRAGALTVKRVANKADSDEPRVVSQRESICS